MSINAAANLLRIFFKPLAAAGVADKSRALPATLCRVAPVDGCAANQGIGLACRLVVTLEAARIRDEFDRFPVAPCSGGKLPGFFGVVIPVTGQAGVVAMILVFPAVRDPVIRPTQACISRQAEAVGVSGHERGCARDSD